MQGTWVPSLIGEGSRCRGATKPMALPLHALEGVFHEKALHSNQKSPWSPQLEKSPHVVKTQNNQKQRKEELSPISRLARQGH